MRLYAILFSAVLLAAPAGAAEPVRAISVTGEGRVVAAPDMATITLGVSEQAREAEAAMATVARQSHAVIERLSAFGIEARDIQTSGLSLNQVYDYRNANGEPPKLVGFAASNRLSVRVRDLDKLGKVLDQVVAAGATEFQGLQFDLADRDAAQDEARKAAVADAQARAKLYAEAAGVRLGAVLSLSEAGGGYVPQPMMRVESLGAEAMPVAAGELTISASVSLSVAIE